MITCANDEVLSGRRRSMSPPMPRLLAGALAALAATVISSAASADSCAPVTRSNVAACAVGASAAVRSDREAVAAAAGRRVAASPWLPSNPVLAVTLARRGGTDGRGDALNYTASLSQEIAIAGQRGARRRAAEADVDARVQEGAATARRVAADGYSAWFDVVAARDAVAVARRLESTAQQIARVTRGRADAGVGSPLEAEVADAASLRVTQARVEAERELRVDTARLAALLGRDPLREHVAVAGDLEPLGGADAIARSASEDLARRRPEVLALANERRAHEARAEALRRARVPSPALQVFAQNDGYDERVLGAGLSVPIPLPEPVGRLHAGEIREAEALARQTGAKRELVERELGAELAAAVATYEGRRAEAALFTRERALRSEQLLSEIRAEIEAGRLPVRDALLAQQQLIDVLRGAVETRRALCLASVELALAAGVALEGGAR
ncbi:MAG: TolC family protein [Labilithrix sp.]|nr:TolC family protein [Labilithrix sp.]